MPILRNRPLLYRARRPFDLQQRAGLLLGTQGLVSDNFRDRLTVASSNGFDGYGADVAWTVQSGAFACSAGKLICSSAGVITIDPGVVDNIRFEFQLAFTPDATTTRFIVRYTDTSNYIGLAITSVSMSWSTLIAGTPAAIGTTAGVVALNNDVIIGSLIGNVMTAQIFRAGVPIGNVATATNSTGAGATPIGLRAGNTAPALGYLKVRRAA